MKQLILSVLILLTVKASGDDRPNIVLVMADDFGRELLSVYGGTSYKTPHLDALATDGVTFDICYATPLCSPTRNLLLSGKYNFRNYTTWGEYDYEESPTFANLIGDAGYDTAVCGKWHLGGWEQKPYGPTRAGFQRYATFDYAKQLAEDENAIGNFFWNTKLELDDRTERLGAQYSPAVFRDFAINFIKEHEKSDTPFLLYYPMILCHRPFMPTDNGGETGEEHRGRRGKLSNFPEMVGYVDDTIGRLRAALAETSQAENTLFIFTADNGTDNVAEAKGLKSKWHNRVVSGEKYLPTELGLNVPFFAVMPDRVESGVRYSMPIELTDVYATLCNLAQVERPADVDGHDLTPALTGVGSVNRQYAYSWGLREHSSRKYKDPRTYSNEILHVIRDVRWKYFSDGQLFDLATSPYESKPVPEEAHLSVRARMQAALEDRRNTKLRLW